MLMRPCLLCWRQLRLKGRSWSESLHDSRKLGWAESFAPPAVVVRAGGVVSREEDGPHCTGAVQEVLVDLMVMLSHEVGPFDPDRADVGTFRQSKDFKLVEGMRIDTGRRCDPFDVADELQHLFLPGRLACGRLLDLLLLLLGVMLGL